MMRGRPGTSACTSYPCPILKSICLQVRLSEVKPVSGSRRPAENRVREIEIFRIRDLEVAQAALHEARRVAEPFDRARFVGQIVAVLLRAQNRLAQHADAEHLRRLRLPQAVAAFGTADAPPGLRPHP